MRRLLFCAEREQRIIKVVKPTHSFKASALKLYAAARLKLFEGERAGVYAREARKACFNAPLGDAARRNNRIFARNERTATNRSGEGYGACENWGPRKCGAFLGKRRSSGASERRFLMQSMKKRRKRYVACDAVVRIIGLQCMRCFLPLDFPRHKGSARSSRGKAIASMPKRSFAVRLQTFAKIALSAF